MYSARFFERLIRRVLPRSFQGRSLLIVSMPLLVTQIVALQLFYGNYLNVVSRRLADSVVSDLAIALDSIEHMPQDTGWIVQRARARLQLEIAFRRGAHLPATPAPFVLGPMDEDLTDSVRRIFGAPCHIDWNATRQSVRLEIPLRDGVLDVIVPRKRLDVGPVWLFVAWEVGSALILFLIASLFVGKQVRAIRRLARAAENFGLGRDDGPIRPQGALEIRKAALAFNRMQARVNRFVAQRTAVLAGVSHDLRTPLTRLRLTLAMLPVEGSVDAQELRPDIEDMITDIGEMERLIGSYLSFARGEGEEDPVPTDLVALLEDVATATTRAGGVVLAIHADDSLVVPVRPDAMRRVLINLAENARRHGGRMAFTLSGTARMAEITIDDDGPGIAQSRRKDVFRAFSTTGPGTGLGLTIARDIMAAHGGSVILRNSPLGGLRVVLKLPR
ncbi:ATP-binding protein [Swaminathania salitolerans]|uniref:histidine kinase n=1 Tax=Swaminathania salitolerans TaxID=182838 RepID=A0A511BPG4_9PROT|nr:ATP-binding protein [Swaminathania salitolerans]GBQ10869.1 two component sensor histidine kinase EnvZ [Swaminathania salitolerans LMG 21291]GEL02207.1 ATPase [Swaminathania salitolerans]